MRLSVFIAAGERDRGRVSEIVERCARLDAEPSDFANAHAVLVLASEDAINEHFEVLAEAHEKRTPILWVETLVTVPASRFRRGRLVVDSLEAAYVVLVSWAKLVERPWPTHLDWVRGTIWNAVLEAEDKSAAERREGVTP